MADGPHLHYGHPRMSLSHRAKIFVPFDPLEGFRVALSQREREIERSYDRSFLPHADRHETRLSHTP